jgi:hypothetical protein
LEEFRSLVVCVLWAPPEEKSVCEMRMCQPETWAAIKSVDCQVIFLLKAVDRVA